MAYFMFEILDAFSSVWVFWCTGMIQIRVFASDFEFWIGVNEY